MKLLIGLSNGSFFYESKNYKMCIVEIDEIASEKQFENEWVELDINKLQECSNVKVNMNNFKSNSQNPVEYLEASFNVNKLIDWGINQKDFQITNVYYDENGIPQLYRIVDSNGHLSMHDISELPYKKGNSILGKTIEELPEFVKKEPLSAAYEWWKAKDENGKKTESKYFSGRFEAHENMSVKLLYHYLTGVKGFKVGYHIQTDVTEDYSSEVQHEYLLYKDTANIKLRESVPKREVSDSLFIGGYDAFGMFGEEKDPYPYKRKLGYYGATMSMICAREKYPIFDFHSAPTSMGTYDKDGIQISIDYRNRLLYTYNKLEANGCISKDWRLSEHNIFFGMTEYALLPNELALLSARLQSEKEGVRYGHVMSATHGHWSTFNTDGWIKAFALALSTQFYSPELREKLNPIFQNYQTFYTSELRELIEKMGAKDALEVMKWSKENSKNVLHDISLIKDDGSIQKANVDVVNQMSNLCTFKRNNYPLPDWLQIYSPETIEALGGVELLQELINKRGEQFAKNAVPILAEGIESERRYELHNQSKQFINTETILTEKTPKI